MTVDPSEPYEMVSVPDIVITNASKPSSVLSNAHSNVIPVN
jgi:hypothetical protein